MITTGGAGAAERIPDPTAAGDFLRRFTATTLGSCKQARKKVWSRKPARFGQKAILDADGTQAATTENGKAGSDIISKGLGLCAAGDLFGEKWGSLGEPGRTPKDTKSR